MANSAFSDSTHSFNSHNNVSVTSIATNDILKFDGTNWINSTVIAGITSLQVDNLNLNGNTLSSTAGTDLLITPLGGQQIVLDGTIIIDAGVVTGATSITSTEFVGGGVGLTALNGTQITSGTVPAAQLGSNHDNARFLRGDNTWQAAGGATIGSTPTENQLVTVANTTSNLDSENNLTFNGTDTFNYQHTGQHNFNLATYSTTDSTHALLNIQKSAHGSLGNVTGALGSGDTIGQIQFQGSQGSIFATGAAIRADSQEDSSWTNGRGTKLSFWTCGKGTHNTLSERLSIDNSGKIGIGITSPVNKLMIVETKNNNTNPTFHISNPTWNDTNVHNYGLYMYQNNAGTGVIGNNNGDRINISTAGNVGIGIASPSKKLHIVGDGFLYENLSDSADEDSASFLVAVKNYSDEFGSIRFEDRRGTQAQPSFIFAAEDGSGGTACFLIKTGTTSTRFQLNQNGDITGTHGSYHTSSDSRAKENIVNSTVGLDAVMQMRPVKFNFIADRGVGTNTRVGFIAQEVEALIPEAVFTADTPNDPIPNIKSIEDPQLIPVLVKAIQELNAKVDALS